MNNLKKNVFVLFVIAVAFALVFPWVLQDGMFGDGVLYATVSKNLANGWGSFWNLHFGKTVYNEFHEQPPLVFFIQSIFFKVLPDSIYPERIYCILMMIAGLFLVMKCWKSFFHSLPEIKEMHFLPALFYFISPVTFWAYTNNVIEITMVNFVLCSVLLLFKFYRTEKGNIFLLAGAGTFIALASLCKGVQGVFTIALPFFYWLIYRKQSFGKMFLHSVLLVFPLIIFYAAVLSSESARIFFKIYFVGRYSAAFNGADDTSGSHFFILWELFQDLLPPIGISLLCFLFVRGRPITNELKKASLFFLFIGLSGVLPLMVTKEQRGFYLITGLPFIMMSIACLTAEKIKSFTLEGSVKFKKIIFSIAVFTLLSSVIAGFCLAGKPKRDEALLHDIYLFGKVIGKDEVTGCSEELFSNWVFMDYLGRYYHISLETGDKKELRKWYIVPKDKTLPEGYEQVKIDSQVLILGKRI